MRFAIRPSLRRFASRFLRALGDASLSYGVSGRGRRGSTSNVATWEAPRGGAYGSRRSSADRGETGPTEVPLGKCPVRYTSTAASTRG
jgi:hypothetical protein